MRIVDQAIDLLGQLSAEIFAAKTAIEHSTSFSNDALHVIAGLLLQLLAALVLRSSLRSVGPWLMVLGLALANELNDLHVQGWPDRPAHWGESGMDIILILLLPTVLLIVARMRPNLLIRRG
jgi:hypothetical protein